MRHDQPMQARLTRSEADKRLAGVCGGIAEYFDFDATLVRIGFVLLALFTGVGILLYVVLWIVLPKGTSSTVETPTVRRQSALRIAEERFARGEISADELEQIRIDLARR
ncbi:MAG TPA: PspC domain-containing protein [Actinomycetota bacterium]|nr:PspC domain-containing protein [Actinomycetota bacterium]